MKSIEVTTSHNIVFRYELAGTVQRILSTIIDLCVSLIYIGIVALAFGGNTFLFYTLGLIPFTLYHLLFEIFWDGQTLGKKALKLQVITLNGTTPKANDFFLRWIFRLVDITLSLGTLSIISILNSDKNQRIGDIIAETSVISLKNSKQTNLQSLKKLNEKKGETQYKGLRNFTDEDMLLLKQAIVRYQEFKTPENRIVVRKIGAKLLEILEIKDPHKLTVPFLKQLLNEYIIITR